MSADRLAEIKARADAATPGPWSAADERELWREEDPSIEPSWCVSQMRPGFEAMSPTEGYVGDVFTTAGFFESTEADARFVAAAREDVPWLVEQVERAEAEVEWWKERFPCDGLCSDAPEEDCSRHGRVPADLWGIIGKVSAERDALAAAHTREREKVWNVEEVMVDIEDSNPTTWKRLRAALAGPTGQECVKVWPDPGHEDEGYSCVTHNCPWDQCPARTGQEAE